MLKECDKNQALREHTGFDCFWRSKDKDKGNTLNKETKHVKSKKQDIYKRL